MSYRFTTGLAAAAFALSLTAPLWAQDRARPADAPTTGSAVPRDSGSSSGSSSSGSSSSGSSSTSSSGYGSSSSGSSSSGWMGNNSYESPRRAPVNPERTGYGDDQRRGGTATGRAVPRDRGDGGGNSGSVTSARSADGDRDSAQGRSRAVPTYSRPRDGRNPLGTAVERTDGYYRNGRPYSYSTFIYDPYYSYYYDPYYRSRYYWSPWGYGYGFGYMAYDPFWFGGFGYPDSYGYYDPYYGAGGYYGGGGGYSGGGYSSSTYHGVGALRLKVKPGDAQVFVDGYLVGTVDSFDGVFQRLNVEAGAHKIELRAEGYQPTQFDVMVLPGKTITYEGDMRRR